MSFIPVNTPLMDGKEKEYLIKCIEDGWISSEGPMVKEFEQGFAKYCGRRFGIAVTNGTVALDITVKALGIGPGDEVIIPTFTIISCASSVVLAGATPKVVDCDCKTWNMDVSKIEAAITPKTKAIMPVHIYGLPVDMDPVMDLAKKYNLKIIEDAAQAHGVTYKGKRCGSFGDLSTFSFYPNKHLTTGEGGMILTNDEDLAARCQSLRNLCFQRNARFVHVELGTNARFTNLQAALGVAQLEGIENKLNTKKEIGKKYLDLLSDFKMLELPPQKTDYADNLFWVFGVVLKDSFKLNAKDVMKKLGELGIGTRPFFYPMHKQPVFLKKGWFEGVSCPVAERIAERGFYLPSGLGLEQGQIEQVVNALKKVLL